MNPVEIYLGVVHKEGIHLYGISFPDFPGCVSVGDSLEEVYVNGVEALSLHIQGMREDHINLPKPSLAKGYPEEQILFFPLFLHNDVELPLDEGS